MMAAFKIFNFSAINGLNYCNLLCLRNTVKIFNAQQSSLSRKTLVKLGIPTPPKKPLTPYMKYLQSNRTKLLQNQPDLSPTDVVKTLAQEWSQCDVEEKKSLQKLFLKEMEIYLMEYEKYKQSITEDQLNLIEKTKRKQKYNAQKSLLHEKEETLGKPKKPCSAFLNFMRENKDSKDESIKYAQWVSELAKKWETHPDKEKYLQQAKSDWATYRSELLVWEENMIRQGHLDVVRNKELLVSKDLINEPSRKRVE